MFLEKLPTGRFINTMLKNGVGVELLPMAKSLVCHRNDMQTKRVAWKIQNAMVTPNPKEAVRKVPCL